VSGPFTFTAQVAGPFNVTSRLIEQVSLAESIRSFTFRQAMSWLVWIVICAIMAPCVKKMGKKKVMTESA